MTSITLRDREIPLTYTTWEMKQIQEEVCKIGDFLPMLFGRKEEGAEAISIYGEPDHLNALAKCIRILGNAGLEENGMEPDLTDKWVLRALKPAKIPEAMEVCLAAMNEGMESEIPKKEKESGEPVDVTLAQLEKKKEKDG